MSTRSDSRQRGNFFMTKYSIVFLVLFLFPAESLWNYTLHSISHSFQQQWHCKPTHFLQGFCNMYFSIDIQQWVTFDLKWTKNILLSKIVCACVGKWGSKVSPQLYFSWVSSDINLFKRELFTLRVTLTNEYRILIWKICFKALRWANLFPFLPKHIFLLFSHIFPL